MHIRINKLASWTILGALLLAGRAPAVEPEGPSRAEIDARWVPSLSFQGGTTAQDMDSGINSRCANGGPEVDIFFPPPRNRTETRPACAFPSLVTPGNLRPVTQEEELAFTPLVGASLAISSPRLGPLPFRPRAFVSGELITFWGTERQIAKENDPGPLEIPEGKFNVNEFTAVAFLGTGSKLTSEVQLLGWGARTGLAFPFEFRERRLWLKPSFGWMQYEIDVEGVVSSALKDDAFPPPGNGTGVREVRLQGSGSETYNSIGPGLELEMEAGQFGPVGISIFAGANAYRVLGNRKIKFSDSKACNATSPCPSNLFNTDFTTTPPSLVPVPEPAIGDDDYSADFSFQVEPWVYRGHVGVRFNWLGR